MTPAVPAQAMSPEKPGPPTPMVAQQQPLAPGTETPFKVEVQDLNVYFRANHVWSEAVYPGWSGPCCRLRQTKEPSPACSSF